MLVKPLFLLEPLHLEDAADSYSLVLCRIEGRWKLVKAEGPLAGRSDE